MNREIRDAWVERLESPEKFGIHQANGYMGDITGGRCCLAVLGDILAERGLIDRRINTVYDQKSRILYDGESSLPTVRMLRLAGIREQDQGLNNTSVAVKVPYNELTTSDQSDSPQRCTLAALNDTYSWSFARIAVKVRAFSADDENETPDPVWETEEERLLNEPIPAGFPAGGTCRCSGCVDARKKIAAREAREAALAEAREADGPSNLDDIPAEGDL